MDGDECGNGFTSSTNPGTTSGWSNEHSYFNQTCLSLKDTPVPQVVWRLIKSVADHIFPAGSLLLGKFYTRLTAKRESRPARSAEWSSLLAHIRERVVRELPFEKVYQPKPVSNSLRKSLASDTFQSFENVTLSALYFFISEGAWQCAGYDSSLRKWRRLPPFSSFLPASCMPDPELLKEYLVCSHGGIVCMNVSKGAEQERLVVLNPLTGEWRQLPPLNHRRNPVLMHLVADATTQSYRVIVAGSAGSGDGRLSRVTEEFDSRTWMWKQTGDLPGPDYALNEFQSGVCRDGSLYCIAFLDHEAGKGILRYNLNTGTWLKNSSYPIPFAAKSSILQLVESWGELYLFSEQDSGNNNIEHIVDKVDLDNIDGRVSLNNVVKRKWMGGKSLEVYPEYTCMPFSEHQLCLFNTIDHSGVVYDVQNHGEYTALEGPPSTGFGGENFYSLNAMTFTLQFTAQLPK